MKKRTIPKRRGTEAIEYSEAVLQLLKTNEPPEPSSEALVLAEIQRGENVCDAIDEETKQLQEQIQNLHEQIKSFQEQIQSSQKQIQSLHGQIWALEAKRRSVIDFIKDHKGIFSPLRRTHLPIEIWTQIFQYVDPVVYISPYKIRSDKGIWGLGRVCSQWRAAIQSFWPLWSKLEILFDRSSLKCAPILEQILAKSRNAPLEFSLDVNLSESRSRSMPERLVVSPSVVNNHLSPVIRMLTAASNRWHSVTLKGIPEAQQQLFAEVKGRLPLLQYLGYDCRTAPVGFEVAPSLRKLGLSGERTLHSLSTMPLPWSQIHECNIHNTSFHDELDVLRLCTNLESYSLSDGPWKFFTSTRMAHMPKLHTLSLFVPSGIGLLHNLTLPSLSTIIFETDSYFDDNYDEEDEEHDDGGFLTRLDGLLSRSSCKLTTLKITCGSRIAESLFGVVKLDNLTSLHMTYMAADGIPFDILTVKPRSRRIALPRLENLHLRPHHRKSSNVDLTPLVELVRSRWELTERRRKTMSRLSFLEYKDVNSDHVPDYDSDSDNSSGRDQPSALAGALAPLLAFREEGLKLLVDNFYLEQAT